jgi:hypothetical protein
LEEHMKVKLLLVMAVVCLLSTAAFAQSPAGKWTGEMQGRGGAQPVVLELAVSGTALTGTITFGQGMPITISEGKVDGNKVTFKAIGGGGGGGGRGGGAPGGGGGGGAAGGPPAGAPPAGAPPAGAGGGGGGQARGGGGGGGRGGGATFVYTGTITGSEMAVSRTIDAAAAPAGGGAPAGAPGGGAAQPQTFTLKKS